MAQDWLQRLQYWRIRFQIRRPPRITRGAGMRMKRVRYQFIENRMDRMATNSRTLVNR